MLVTIETDRYQVAVDQAKAALDRAQADRRRPPRPSSRGAQGAVAQHPGLVAGEEIAQYETAVATAKADVASAARRRCASRSSTCATRTCARRSPASSSRAPCRRASTCSPGAVLATILQRDPLLLRFGVTEQDAPRLKAGMTANMSLRESTRTYTAKIILVADAADPTTRLVPVTGAGRRHRAQVLAAPGRVLRGQRAGRRRAPGDRRAVDRRAADRRRATSSTSSTTRTSRT